MNYLLGIDLGTSSLKTIVMSLDGKILASDAVDYQYDSPVQGYAEQDPEVWWRACVDTVKNAVGRSGVQAAPAPMPAQPSTWRWLSSFVPQDTQVPSLRRPTVKSGPAQISTMPVQSPTSVRLLPL